MYLKRFGLEVDDDEIGNLASPLYIFFYHEATTDINTIMGMIIASEIVIDGH